MRSKTQRLPEYVSVSDFLHPKALVVPVVVDSDTSNPAEMKSETKPPEALHPTVVESVMAALPAGLSVQSVVAETCFQTKFWCGSPSPTCCALCSTMGSQSIGLPAARAAEVMAMKVRVNFMLKRFPILRVSGQLTVNTVS